MVTDRAEESRKSMGIQLEAAREVIDNAPISQIHKHTQWHCQAKRNEWSERGRTGRRRDKKVKEVWRSSRELAMEISLVSLGSSQTFPRPHFSTLAASRFCSFSDTISPPFRRGPSHVPNLPHQHTDGELRQNSKLSAINTPRIWWRVSDLFVSSAKSRVLRSPQIRIQSALGPKANWAHSLMLSCSLYLNLTLGNAQCTHKVFWIFFITWKHKWP